MISAGTRRRRRRRRRVPREHRARTRDRPQQPSGASKICPSDRRADARAHQTTVRINLQTVPTAPLHLSSSRDVHSAVSQLLLLLRGVHLAAQGRLTPMRGEQKPRRECRLGDTAALCLGKSNPAGARAERVRCGRRRRLGRGVRVAGRARRSSPTRAEAGAMVRTSGGRTFSWGEGFCGVLRHAPGSA